MSERVLVGPGVGTGVAIAKAFSHRADRYVSWDIDVAGSSRGLLAIKTALGQVSIEIEEAKTDSSQDGAEILEALQMVLEDQSLMDEIKLRLADGANARRAVLGAFNTAAKTLSQLGDYFAERATDIDELGERVLDKLTGKADLVLPNEPFVLVTDVLGPLELLKLRQSKIVGLVTSQGSPTSHTAILARGLNLPTVLAVKGAELISTGDELIVDASSGQVLVNPNESEVALYSSTLENIEEFRPVSVESLNLPVKLYANLGSSSEGESAKRYGAQGVGLFRTELLFLGEKVAPSLETQVSEYSLLLEQFPNEVVIVRVLDLDTDKPLPFLKSNKEGKYSDRGFEALLANPEVLRTQLAALQIAQQRNPESDLWVMAPMVSTVEQAKEFVALSRESGLKRVGVMIEVPEICEPNVLSEIVSLVDFLSIGTNDLTQYTLKQDRLNHPLSLSAVREPEVMDLIKRATSAAAQAGKPIGICGEAASDYESAKLFIEFGVSSLSSSPALIPGLAMKLSS